MSWEQIDFAVGILIGVIVGGLLASISMVLPWRR